MSGWDSYIDNLIAHSKDPSGEEHIDAAAIIGLSGGAMWTSSSHAKALKITQAEASNMARCFASKDFTAFMSNGIRAAEVKYQFLRVEDDKVAMGKKKGEGSITLQATKTAIVICHCPEGKQQGNANTACGKVAEYLESVGM